MFPTSILKMYAYISLIIIKNGRDNELDLGQYNTLDGRVGNRIVPCRDALRRGRGQISVMSPLTKGKLALFQPLPVKTVRRRYSFMFRLGRTVPRRDTLTPTIILGTIPIDQHFDLCILTL
ncbi:hypothetical protein J6590_037328 [Homalodisca vitripennis]|nr:hypothetical protein J6590_037328 [Homalodisca vitripennis]